jgi:hypothetical protein
MKHQYIKINHLVLFTIFLILSSGYKSVKFNLQEFARNALEAESENNIDSDDLIFQMKSFFDSYANKLKNSMKGVDKLIIPSNTSVPEIVYSTSYDLDDFKKQTGNFLEDNIQMREKDLKNQRESKQNVEEKYIDLITKNKILKSRINIANSENNKMTNDFNEKINLKTSQETELKDFKEKSEKFIFDNYEKLQILKNFTRAYDDKIQKLKFNETVFEDEMKIQNNLEKLKTEIFKSDFETQFILNLNSSKSDFIIKAIALDDLFKRKRDDIQVQILVAEANIKNKTDTIKNFKREIENKYLTFDNLNNTVGKLKNIQSDYKNALRELEETLSRLKSKKSIIEENIADKKKHANIRKRTIESILNNLEKKLENYNVDKINVNKYRKDITNINSRLRNMLNRENMIFMKNKIKI